MVALGHRQRRPRLTGLLLRLLQVYVLKRPHVDEFLQRMGQLFECVLFTASLAKVCPSPSWAPPATPPRLPVCQTARC